MNFPNFHSERFANSIAPVIFLALIFAFVQSAAGQSKDSDPVLQGSTKYSMPQSVIDAEIDGTVVLAIHVDETGKATQAQVTSGPMWPCGTTPTREIELLYSTLADMAKTLTFLPATKKSEPISADIGFTINLKNSKVPSTAKEIDPATGKPKYQTVSGGVLNGKAKALARPGYPDSAKSARASGAVSIQVLIGEEGKILRAGAVSGHPLLQFAARAAACESKFTPTLLAGNPVKVSGVITYNFVP